MRNITIEKITRAANQLLKKSRKGKKNQNPIDSIQQVEMALTPEQLQDFMQAINQQGQTQQQQVLDLQARQQATVDQLALQLQRNQARHPHARDLPQFSSQLYDDPVNFLKRYEAVAVVNHWTDAEKLTNFPLSHQNNALKWFKAQPVFPTFDDAKTLFMTTFKNTRFELDLSGENGKMLAKKILQVTCSMG